MTYFANIPQKGDRPATSQGQILANFGTLNAAFAVDHITYGQADAGEHYLFLGVVYILSIQMSFLIGGQNYIMLLKMRPDFYRTLFLCQR